MLQVWEGRGCVVVRCGKRLRKQWIYLAMWGVSDTIFTGFSPSPKRQSYKNSSTPTNTHLLFSHLHNLTRKHHGINDKNKEDYSTIGGI